MSYILRDMSFFYFCALLPGQTASVFNQARKYLMVNKVNIDLLYTISVKYGGIELTSVFFNLMSCALCYKLEIRPSDRFLNNNIYVHVC
jgi:hypothetical protein